jgi:DeoR family deoxyribose operon repressor
VILDSGSTTECLARALPLDSRATVMCFALNILIEVRRREGCRIVLGGGELHENSLMLESQESVHLIRRYRANRAFLSASGVSDRVGVTCANMYEVDTKKAAIASSLERVLLADSSKFGKIHPAHFAELADFGVIVTDSGISPDTAERVRSLGITLHVV